MKKVKNTPARQLDAHDLQALVGANQALQKAVEDIQRSQAAHAAAVGGLQAISAHVRSKYAIADGEAIDSEGRIAAVKPA